MKGRNLKSEPKDCRITVTGRGVWTYHINDNMGMYQDIVMQWRYHHTNINDALLDSLSRRTLQKDGSILRILIDVCLYSVHNLEAAAAI